MRLVYMLMHQRKPNVSELTRMLAGAFQKAGIVVSAEPWLAARMQAEALFSDALPEECDAVISVGGDGTFLRSNALAVALGKPILGINAGRVGFLTEVEPAGLSEACARMAAGEYEIEERMMLKAEVDGQTLLALNDVVLSRGVHARLIGVNAWAGSEQMGKFIGDGVIVSTPTGSTGYSLSAGGPIVCPEVSCMLLTPICAHSLQHRPVVTSAGQIITLRLDEKHAPTAMVSVDGQKAMSLRTGQTMTVTQSERPARFIRLEPTSFFHMIRIKLSEWSC